MCGGYPEDVCGGRVAAQANTLGAAEGFIRGNMKEIFGAGGAGFG